MEKKKDLRLKERKNEIYFLRKRVQELETCLKEYADVNHWNSSEDTMGNKYFMENGFCEAQNVLKEKRNKVRA